MSDEQTPPTQAPTDPAPDPAAAGEDETRVEQATVPAGVPAATPVASRPRFTQRLSGVRALAAVAVASVIIGGLGGVAIGEAGDHQGGNDRSGHGLRPGGQMGGPAGPDWRPGVGPGQGQPGPGQPDQREPDHHQQDQGQHDQD